MAPPESVPTTILTAKMWSAGREWLTDPKSMERCTQESLPELHGFISCSPLAITSHAAPFAGQSIRYASIRPFFLVLKPSIALHVVSLVAPSISSAPAAPYQIWYFAGSLSADPLLDFSRSSPGSASRSGS